MDRRFFVKALGAVPFGFTSGDFSKVIDSWQHPRTIAIEKFDHSLLALQPGDLTVICGRPCIGKTSLMARMTVEMLASKKLAVTFFSLELSRKSLTERLQRQGLPTKCDLFIDDAHGVTIADISRKISSLKQRPDVVIVDYLQLIESPDQVKNKSQDRRLQMSQILKDLKKLAVEQQLSVLVTAQEDRRFEQDKFRVPSGKDIRDFTNLHEVENILFLYRASGGSVRCKFI
jgi:replicative DNA helicase